MGSFQCRYFLNGWRQSAPSTLYSPYVSPGVSYQLLGLSLLLKVAIEQFGIRSTNCRTQAQQGVHLSMGFPAFRVPEPPLGRRAVAHPPPCTSWAVLVSGKHPSVTIHKTHGSHTPSIPRHWSAAGLMRSSFVLEKKTGKFRGEVLHIPVASHKRGNEKYCNINLYVML